MEVEWREEYEREKVAREVEELRRKEIKKQEAGKINEQELKDRQNRCQI